MLTAGIDPVKAIRLGDLESSLCAKKLQNHEFSIDELAATFYWA
jgi:hypothetical protein